MSSLPAHLFVALFEQVVERISAKPIRVATAWIQVRQQFSVVWTADASTLEALQKHFAQLQAQAGSVLAGKMMMVVEAFTHHPVALWYTSDAKANETQWWSALLERMPPAGLLVVDIGFYGFEWFDAFTEANKFGLTRQKQKVRYDVVQVLLTGNSYRDELIEMGRHHPNPCRHQMRLVSVLWGKTWYRYLTNVVEPTQLSEQQVCDLYRQHWKIEDAFLITKRLLGLSYLSVGGSNGVQLQLYAT